MEIKQKELNRINTRKVLLWGSILAILVFLAYANHFHNPFHFDDDHTIVSNVAIRDLGNIPRFFKDGSTTSTLPMNQAFRPGVTTLNTIDYAISYKMTGKTVPDPFYFHISIFISFLLLGVCLFFLFLKIFNEAISGHPWNPLTAILGTGVFMLHTANAETINYIISRSDSFSTLMLLATMLMFLNSNISRKYFLYLIPLFFGFIVKEPVLMFAPLIFFYVLFFENYPVQQNLSRGRISAIGKSFLSALPSLAFGVILFLWAQSKTPKTWDSGGGEMLPYLLTQPAVMLHYVANFILPANLSADTDWVPVTRYFDEKVIIGFAFVAGMLYIAWRCMKDRENRPITYGILWFFIALLPTSSVIPFAEVLNDHRPFFPYIGLTMALTWWIALRIYKLPEGSFTVAKQWLVFALITFFFMAHLFGVRERNKVWSSGESLWKDVVEKSPRNGRGLMNYGNALMARGEFEGAWNCYQAALTLLPNYSYLYINMGVLKDAVGDPGVAEACFKKAIELNPENPESYVYYGKFLLDKKRFSDAKQDIETGLKYSPQHDQLLSLKARLDASPGQNESPLDLAIKTAANFPSPENYLELSLQYYYAGKFEMVIKAAEEAIKLKPDYALAYNNMCSAYNQLKQWDNAILAGKKAVELDPNNQLAKNNLAEAIRQKELQGKTNR